MFRRILIRIAVGALIGGACGVLVAVIWVSIDWIYTVRSGGSPVLPYVEYIYTITAAYGGIIGAFVGGAIGAAVGATKSKT
jgi:hypothetical protein